MTLPPEITQQVINIVATIVITLLTALATYIGAKVKAWLDGQLGAQKTTKLRTFATDMVRFLMQSPAYKEWAGEEKKQFALGRILEYAESIGMKVDEKTADMLIESLYAVAKAQWGPIVDELLEVPEG